MKYAVSMRYGGELVDAAECNHEDFNYLKPLCPNCKEPVLLRTASDRTSKTGKTFTVSAYWCHFPTKDAALAEQCELRVSQYTDAEIQRRATQARGQRLKLFQRWFWDVVRKLPMSNEAGESLEGILEPHWELYANTPAYQHYSNRITDLVIKVFKLPTIRDRIAEVLRQFLDGDFDYFNQESGGETPAHIREYLDNFRATVDMRLQRQIVSEAIGFLCSPRGIQFLQAFSFNAIIPFFEGGLPNLSPQFVLLCADNAIAIVGLIPWAAEFERLQKEGNNATK